MIMNMLSNIKMTLFLRFLFQVLTDVWTTLDKLFILNIRGGRSTAHLL